MADLTSGQAARLDDMRGKAKNLQVGTRIRNLELMTDPTLGGQFQVYAAEAISQYEFVAATSYNTTNACLSVNLADANNNRMAVGYATADISSGEVGYASNIGIVAADTSGAGAVGDPWYLSSGTPGAGTATEPVGATDIKQILGQVAVDNATGYVAVNIGQELILHSHADAYDGGAISIASATNLDVGADGTPGTLDIFPTSASNSKMIFTCTDIGATSRNITITNAAQAAARTYTIPDAGASASFVMTGTADQSILGDVILGAATTSDADLKLFSHTAASGSLLIKAGDNSGNDVTTLSSATTAVGATGAAITVYLPSVAGTLIHSGVQDQAIAGDLALGSDTVAGTLTLNSITTANGTTVLQHQDDSNNKVTTLQNNSTTTGASCTITLPSTTGTLLGTGTGNPAADVILGGDLQLGADAVEGALTLYPATTNKGTFVIFAADNSASDSITTLQNGQAGAACTLTLPTATGALLGTAGNAAGDITFVGDLTLGQDATEGLVTLYPATTNSGTFVIQATNNTGDDIVTLASPGTATGGNITVTLPSVTGTLVWAQSVQKQAYPFQMTYETGAALAVFAGAGADGFTQETNEEVVMRWNNSGTPTKMAALFHIPNDLDDSADVVVHFIGMPSGTTDSPTMATESYFSGVVGNAINADAAISGVSTEFTNVATWQECTKTISAADVYAAPCTLTVIFNPTDGELGTDDFLLASVWLEYKGKPLTS